MPVRFARKDNLYAGLNLPADYDSLNLNGKQLARKNGLHLQETAKDLVGAWSLLKAYYFMDDPEKDFFPGFFKRYKPTPPVHRTAIKNIGQYAYNVFAFPRGYAKSTISVILAMLMFLTRKNFYTMFIYSGEKMVYDRFGEIMYQLEKNERILEDFGGVKGDGQWNRSRLTNDITRSRIAGMPVRGSLYGPRPDLIIPDDCEFDPQLQRVTMELIEQFDGLMHNTILPMMDLGQSAIAVFGTLHNNRTWISRWLKGREEDDERLSVWNRMLFSAEDRREDGKLLWEEKFDEEALAHERKKLGAAGYATQRLNRPGEGGSSVLEIHPQLCQYEVTKMDDRYTGGLNVTPLDSTAVFKSWKRTDGKIQEITRPFGPTVSKMFRVTLMDYAQCNSPSSDMVCIMEIGAETSKWYKDTWWILDLFLGRIRGEQLYKQLFAVASRWRSHYIGIEAVAAQQELLHNAEAYLPTMAARFGWNPKMYPIRYPPGLSKADRINSLEWRFNQYRIKYPLHYRRRRMWNLLYTQTEQWTGEEGCLTFDDAVDTVAMMDTMLGGRKHTSFDSLADPEIVSLREELIQNPRAEVIPGVPVGLGVNPSDLPASFLQDLTLTDQEEKNEDRRKYKWIGPTRR